TMKAGKFSYTFLCQGSIEENVPQKYLANGPVEELRKPRQDFKALVALGKLLKERSLVFSEKDEGVAKDVLGDLVNKFPAEKDLRDLSNIGEL
ncbi:MAG: hypothetical protein Q9174_006279, partial [Haloplaca sp. 1 TL-2023]